MLSPNHKHVDQSLVAVFLITVEDHYGIVTTIVKLVVAQKSTEPSFIK